MRSLILSLIIVVLSIQGFYAQELKSDKVKFRLNNISSENEEEMVDTIPPVIEIIAPVDREGQIFKSSVAEIDLIGQVRDRSGINFVSVDSKVTELNEKGLFTYSIQLEPGINSIRLVAMDEERNYQEQFVTIQYEVPVLSLADRIAKESLYYGIIIGIDDYSDSNLPDLNNPIKDAERLYETLISNYSFKGENLRLLRNATRGDLIKNLDEMSQIVTEDDNLLIFYAGHGWWDEESTNGYWLPSDAELHVKTNWFRNSALVDYLKEINSKHTLLITDACFGGSIFKTRSAFPNREKAYEKLYDLPSRKAMTSGTLTEVPDRSSFTKYLIERLDANEQTYLSSEQLFSSFRIAVINNSDAIPQYGEISNVGDQGGDFIFLKNR